MPLWAKQLLMASWIYGVMVIVLLLLDIVTGPYLMFPILFVAPVALAAWFVNARLAYLLAVVLPLGRFGVAAMLEHHQIPEGYAAMNAVIRIIVLVSFGYLVSRTARQTRELQKEVTLLQGILHMCMFCKRIRDEKKGWEPLEDYISQHSEADFSHGLCPECALQHYGKVISTGR